MAPRRIEGRALLDAVLAPSEWIEPTKIKGVEQYYHYGGPRPFFRGTDGFYYMICPGTAGNVLMVKRRRYNQYQAVVTVCRHPREFYNEEECWVGQICALKSDALDFMARANEYTIFDNKLHYEMQLVWAAYRDKQAGISPTTPGYRADGCNCPECMRDRARYG